MRGSTPPPILKPQPFSVGVFSCLIAPVPAYSCGFLRTPADFANRLNWPFRATFHSLLAIPRSDLALRNRPEVRKVRDRPHYRSMGYARTNQAVGLQHRVAKETLSLHFVGSYRSLPTDCNTDARAWMRPGRERHCQDNVRMTTIKASKISPEVLHEYPESFQDRTH